MLYQGHTTHPRVPTTPTHRSVYLCFDFHGHVGAIYTVLEANYLLGVFQALSLWEGVESRYFEYLIQTRYLISISTTTIHHHLHAIFQGHTTHPRLSTTPTQTPPAIKNIAHT